MVVNKLKISFISMCCSCILVAICVVVMIYLFVADTAKLTRLEASLIAISVACINSFMSPILYDFISRYEGKKAHRKFLKKISENIASSTKRPLPIKMLKEYFAIIDKDLVYVGTDEYYSVVYEINFWLNKIESRLAADDVLRQNPTNYGELANINDMRNSLSNAIGRLINMIWGKI